MFHVLAIVQGEGEQPAGLQVFGVEMYSPDAVVLIGLEVVDALFPIDTAGIGGDVALAFGGDHAAPHHGHAVQDVEKLGHGVVRGAAPYGVVFQEAGFHVPGLRRKIPRQPDGPHALAVGCQGQCGGKAVFRRFGRKMLKIVQRRQLEGERRVVGQHPGRVFINMKAVLHGFQHQGTGGVGQMPVQGGQGIPFAEGNSQQLHRLKQFPGLGQIFAAAQHQRDQFIGGYGIRSGFFRRGIPGVAGKIQPRHIQAFFVGGFGVERDIFGHVGHADEREVPGHGRAAVKAEFVPPGSDDDLFTKGVLQIQIAPVQAQGRRNGDTCAHGMASFLWLSEYLQYTLYGRKIQWFEQRNPAVVEKRIHPD